MDDFYDRRKDRKRREKEDRRNPGSSQNSRQHPAQEIPGPSTGRDTEMHDFEDFPGEEDAMDDSARGTTADLQASESDENSEDDTGNEEDSGANILDNILRDAEIEEEPEPGENEVGDNEMMTIKLVSYLMNNNFAFANLSWSEERLMDVFMCFQDSLEVVLN